VEPVGEPDVTDAAAKASPAARPAGDAVARAKRVEQVLTHLMVALKNAMLYGGQHGKATESAREAYDAIEAGLREAASLEVTRVGQELLFEGIPLQDYSSALTSLADMMAARDVGRLTIRRGVRASDVEGLVQILVAEPGMLAMNGGPEEAIQRLGIANIDLLRCQTVTSPLSVSREDSQRSSIELYQDALAATKQAMASVERNQTIDATVVRAIVGEMLGSILSDHRALISLTAIKSYDDYLYEHSVNLSVICMFFGYTLGLSDTQLCDLGSAALLHDVGKVFVPVEIVRKPGPLTEEEWMAMHSHPVIGARILARTKGLPGLCSVVAFEHHVRWDYSGYPQLLHRKALNFYSCLVTVVDCYDSLTTTRPYRTRMSPQEAVGWMVYFGRQQFEPRLLNRFAALLDIPPIGTVVRLNSGEWAVVVRGSTKDHGRPVVRLLVDQQGENVASYGWEVDLGERDPASKEHVVKIAERLPTSADATHEIAEALASIR
jgi:HD-GYP domain-containing protein (c-di-GMP phosphodiesterase class II)